MNPVKTIKIAIGFATGRKNFQKVLRSNIHSWKESGLLADKNISLHVFIAYDLTYNKTVKKDYLNIQPELAAEIDSITLILMKKWII